MAPSDALIPERWAEAIARVRGECGADEAVAFEPMPIQPPADCMFWTPDALPQNMDEQLRRFAALVKRAGFLALPVKNDAEAEHFFGVLEAHTSVHEWICQGGYIIGTVKKWGPVPWLEARGALEPKERLKNIRKNCASPMRRMDTTIAPHGRPCVLVCYGPSLKKTWRVAVEQARLMGATIVTVSGAHDFLLDRGVKPGFHIEFDPREHKADIFAVPQKETIYLMASRCHPKLRKKLMGFNAAMWHAAQGKESEEILKIEKKDGILIPGGSCVGLRAITVMYTLGFRYFSIYGFDCSMDEQGEWAGKHSGQTKPDTVQVRCGERVFTTAPLYTIYARQFFDTVWRLPDAEFYLQGDGLLQEMAKQREILANKEKAA